MPNYFPPSQRFPEARSGAYIHYTHHPHHVLPLPSTLIFDSPPMGSDPPTPPPPPPHSGPPPKIQLPAMDPRQWEHLPRQDQTWPTHDLRRLSTSPSNVSQGSWLEGTSHAPLRYSMNPNLQAPQPLPHRPPHLNLDQTFYQMQSPRGGQPSSLQSPGYRALSPATPIRRPPSPAPSSRPQSRLHWLLRCPSSFVRLLHV